MRRLSLGGRVRFEEGPSSGLDDDFLGIESRNSAQGSTEEESEAEYDREEADRGEGVLWGEGRVVVGFLFVCAHFHAHSGGRGGRSKLSVVIEWEEGCVVRSSADVDSCHSRGGSLRGRLELSSIYYMHRGNSDIERAHHVGVGVDEGAGLRHLQGSRRGHTSGVKVISQALNMLVKLLANWY